MQRDLCGPAHRGGSAVHSSGGGVGRRARRLGKRCAHVDASWRVLVVLVVIECRGSAHRLGRRDGGRAAGRRRPLNIKRGGGRRVERHEELECECGECERCGDADTLCASPCRSCCPARPHRSTSSVTSERAARLWRWRVGGVAIVRQFSGAARKRRPVVRARDEPGTRTTRGDCTGAMPAREEEPWASSRICGTRRRTSTS
jgi:hypothetical protein